MSDTDLNIHTSDDGGRLANEPITPNRRSDRVRWGSAVAGLAAFVLLPVMAGCSGDDDDPSAPTSLAPPVETFPAPPSGAGVPLEPGSNLPPGQGEGGGDVDGDVDNDNDNDNDMDVDGDGVGESDGDDDG